MLVTGAQSILGRQQLCLQLVLMLHLRGGAMVAMVTELKPLGGRTCTHLSVQPLQQLGEGVSSVVDLLEAVLQGRQQLLCLLHRRHAARLQSLPAGLGPAL